ncbi:MAG: hypothetical protein L0Y35_05725 [Flammeovirgaceae bacterium]|nr:hypothetical protein [Flammeovirgaceae bacterium]
MVALKLFRAVWFLSVFLSMTALLYAYASIQGDILLLEGNETLASASRDSFVYAGMALLALINVSVYLAKAAIKDEVILSWYYGLVITINIFLIVSFSYVQLNSSGEKFDFERIGFIIYGSLFLCGLWLLAGLPLMILRRRNIKSMT